MKPRACVLTIVAPRALEENLVDQLLEHPDWVTGFTTSAAEGHGQSIRRYGIAEEVRGRSRRIQIQSVLKLADARALVALLRETLPSPEVAYWVVPLIEFGRLA